MSLGELSVFEGLGMREEGPLWCIRRTGWSDKLGARLGGILCIVCKAARRG